MKKIPLTQGQEAIVDDWWFDYLMQWKWYAHWSENTNSFYAKRSERKPRKRIVCMHRVVAQTPNGMICDHIHHNTLDNRENELRNVTPLQSQMNRGGLKNSKIGIKGVFAYGKNGRYRTQLTFKGRIVLDKTFSTIEEAVKAHAEAEKKYHGKFVYQEEVS